MAGNRPQTVWILSLQSKRHTAGEPNYFFRLAGDFTKLVSILVTSSFERVDDQTYNEDVDVRVGILRVSRKSRADSWSVGTEPHHYHLAEAGLQATIEALKGTELQHTTRFTDAVEGALGEQFNLFL